MPTYGTGLHNWPAPPPDTVHDAHVMTFGIDTSPSIFSKIDDPIIRITPSPAPDDFSSTPHSRHARSSHRPKMSPYDDPAFSADPRSNPHFVPYDGQWLNLPSYSDATDQMGAMSYHDLRSAQSPSNTPPNVPNVTPPFASNDDSPNANFASLFTPTRSKQSTTPSESSLSDSRSLKSSPDQSGQGKQRRKSPRPSPSHDLDRIDELDESDPFGTRYHHHGPYQTVNEAFTASKHSLPRNDTATNQPRSLPRIHHQPPMPIGVSINLVPGQIFPKMPYQPQPPANYMSPPPTFGPIYPDLHPYDVPSPPHLSPPSHDTYVSDSRAPTTVSSPAPQFARLPSFPNPQDPDPESNSVSSPPLRSQRHSLPAPARPPMQPQENHSLLAQTLQRTPSDPVRAPPRENAPPAALSLPHPARTTKPVPRHLPKKLVMPTPLQQQQQAAPRQPNHPPIDDGYVRSADRDDYIIRNTTNGAEYGHNPSLLMSRAQDIPMMQEDKGARRLLKKKTTSGAPGMPPANGLVYSKSLGGSDDVLVEQEQPVKEQSGGLFRGSVKTGPKVGRKLSKRR